MQKRERNVKKVWCTCEVVVLLIKPIVFFTFSLPSASLDLKVATEALTRSAVEAKCMLIIRIDSYWLLARVRYAMDRLPYFVGLLIRECIGHKPSLCFPNQFLKTITGVVEDVPRSLTVRGCVCFPTQRLHASCSVRMFGSFNQRAQAVLSPSHALRVHVTLNSPK